MNIYDNYVEIVFTTRWLSFNELFLYVLAEIQSYLLSMSPQIFYPQSIQSIQWNEYSRPLCWYISLIWVFQYMMY